MNTTLDFARAQNTARIIIPLTPADDASGNIQPHACLPSGKYRRLYHPDRTVFHQRKRFGATTRGWHACWLVQTWHCFDGDPSSNLSHSACAYVPNAVLPAATAAHIKQTRPMRTCRAISLPNAALLRLYATEAWQLCA